MAKLYDLAVVTREYEDVHGHKKAAWENIGAIFEKDGKKYMMLKAHFNPAAIQRKEGSESILVSLFAPKDKNSNNSQDFGYSADGSAEFQDNSPSQEYNSNIPF